VVLKLFKVLVVVLVAVFSVCGLALLLSGVATLFRTANNGGIGTFAGGVSFGFMKLIAVSVVVLAVGLFGLTRLRRFLR
jgi:hypothetical protein